MSTWSSCSKTCGSGTKRRSIQIQAKYGGLQCSSQLSKSCHLRSCPGQSIFFINFKGVDYFYFYSVNCVLSQWSSCSKTCGSGTQTRSIQIQAKNGGLQCSSQLSKSCHLKSCPGQSITLIKCKGLEQIYFCLVNCVMSTWSSCSKTCGPGTQTRRIQIQAKYGGTQCSSQLTKSCNLGDCPGQSITFNEKSTKMKQWFLLLFLLHKTVF